MTTFQNGTGHNINLFFQTLLLIKKAQQKNYHLIENSALYNVFSY